MGTCNNVFHSVKEKKARGSRDEIQCSQRGEPGQEEQAGRTDEPIDDEEDPEAACEKSCIFNATRQTSITTFFKGKYSTVYDT